MSSAWKTKGSVYNAQRSFPGSNLVKKSAHYTRVNTVIPFTVYFNMLDLHPGNFIEDSPISYVGSF